ncbi:DUF4389 domain-containing protein [Arthrobacter glacialis]|uniref:DUF4389 domain-containing protein n=1 Tax=Arthrobacter glacialis TaxID=1664 RepID=A0A2S3ZW05_ARTGL|nr:DUF4389 domain-containing protein [Arthrobacter glacialis]POH57124.1 DUF4389 domain-containing protein [Arthrobacter glacialis]POH73142.1 DUF4389 domain-containing protein [Arthrobacter glacialis]
MTSNSVVDGSKRPSGNTQGGAAGFVVALVLGTLLALFGAGGVIGGVASAVVSSQQGSEGYFTSEAREFATTSYALSSPPAQLGVESIPFDLGSIRLSAESAAPGGQVFIGIGPKAEVESYLNGVHTTVITGVETRPFRVSYSDVPGQAAPELPGEQSFWAVQASGTGTQQVTMDLRSGDWVMVIMNADASPGVTVNMAAGFHSELFGAITPALLTGGVAALIIGAGLIALGAVGLGRRHPSSRQPVPDNPVTGDGVSPSEHAYAKGYPARLTGQLDPQLSRGLWLVKWLLALPHMIVLFFLWCAVVITTIFAGFAILFTGRYPRALFNFNVGVLRWSWRVTFYAYSALATDKYPPFTLAATEYPADFEVDYPRQLSRGLVLVKWWLLVLPHLLVVAIFTSAAWSMWGQSGDWQSDYGHRVGFSLLGILVLIAAVGLLFTGRYQRPLFDLIMGINRWIYRVASYALLLRDEYPPFRLDQGPDEPVKADHH